MSEYRAMINTQISVHKMKGNELREVVPLATMTEHAVPQNKVVMIDGESEHQVLQKVREWLALAK